MEDFIKEYVEQALDAEYFKKVHVRRNRMTDNDSGKNNPYWEVSAVSAILWFWWMHCAVFLSFLGVPKIGVVSRSLYCQGDEVY